MTDIARLIGSFFKPLRAAVVPVALLAPALVSCSQPSETPPAEPDTLAVIRERGELVVLTLAGPTSYEAGPDGPTGYEVDLARAFADSLGVTARFEVADSIPDLLNALTAGAGHLAAAGLTQTTERSALLAFAPAYKSVTEQLVCRRDGPTPTRRNALADTDILVLEGSSYEETLRTLQATLPALRWRTMPAGSAMPLLDAVERGDADCTVADSHLTDFARRRHPELVVAQNLSNEQPLAWAYDARVDGLAPALTAWFAEAHDNGLLEALDETWFGQFGDYDYVDIARFVRRVDNRLPRYRRWFEAAAEDLPFEWDLLAAQAYQESHWDPEAVSATGVRGLMMLTLSTAERVGIEDRTDPLQSIRGGAAYLDDLYARVPDGVVGEDRLWFALAAYNVGMGHMYDARRLAERLGRDKNSWDDLAETLPLLSDPQYYSTLRYGYARGHEPVRYVAKIREYRAMLAAQGL
ncbi:membrane-bound lytic murein transglycosylase MltF [Maricaulis maris]|uniref:Membrane-bound lytic murein transglycosylase F n=1 Tax=Maricaulis maris TaxID=74318 RepID=A0A495D1D6_9PROT|nr:membrane-bound lytic murein transglycosylase MltF [Maricaulis maris]RKQ95324.1 membrane-bound lytic murein transglycosylase F [Maricaulis maris]